MRKYERIIQEAELLVMSPDSVAEFLKKRAKQEIYTFDDADLVDEEAEMSLRGRANPLIDLALARYARFSKTLRTIFQNSQPDSALRLAVLSNSAKLQLEFEVGLKISSFPENLFSDHEQFMHWLTDDASFEELLALFKNPMINDLFLRDLLERKKPWDILSEERLAMIVLGLGSNERMWTPYDGRGDGFALAQYDAVFNSAWKLAEIVEPSKDWALVLSRLYERLSTDAYTVKDPLQLTDRWRLELSKPELAKEETKNNDFGYMSDYQGVRKGLAKLALSKDHALLPQLLLSPDIALRAAAYAYGRLTPEQLLSAYQQDGGHFVFEETINNLEIWCIPECRDVLESTDPHFFNKVLKKIADDDGNISIEVRVKRIESKMMSSAQDVHNLQTVLEDIKSGVAELVQENIAEIYKVRKEIRFAMKWGFWLSIILLGALIKGFGWSWSSLWK